MMATTLIWLFDHAKKCSLGRQLTWFCCSMTPLKCLLKQSFHVVFSFACVLWLCITCMIVLYSVSVGMLLFSCLCCSVQTLWSSALKQDSNALYMVLLRSIANSLNSVSLGTCRRSLRTERSLQTRTAFSTHWGSVDSSLSLTTSSSQPSSPVSVWVCFCIFKNLFVLLMLATHLKVLSPFWDRFPPPPTIFVQKILQKIFMTLDRATSDRIPSIANE